MNFISKGSSLLSCSANTLEDSSKIRSLEDVDILRVELLDILKLNDEQYLNLTQLAIGLQREQIRLDSVKISAVALRSLNCFNFSSGDVIYSGFRGVLTGLQMEQFVGSFLLLCVLISFFLPFFHEFHERCNEYLVNVRHTRPRFHHWPDQCTRVCSFLNMPL